MTRGNYTDSDWLDEFDKIQEETPEDYMNPGLTAACPTCRAAYGYETEEEMQAAIEEEEIIDEGSFSAWPCDRCHTYLAGDRHHAHAYYQEYIYCFDICPDCYLFIANGEGPDPANSPR